jgi:hypothetical protein
MARLRDAFFMTNPEDIAGVEEFLKSKGMSDAEIAKKKLDDWNFFLRFSRRRIPPADELLQRFRRVMAAYKEVMDGKLKEPLMRKETLKQVRAFASASASSPPASVFASAQASCPSACCLFFCPSVYLVCLRVCLLSVCSVGCLMLYIVAASIIIEVS